MSEARTYKGHLIEAAAKCAMGGPWRGMIERLTCVVGHTFPTNRLVISFCRHFGNLLIQKEGKQFRRTVTFDSGGQMLCAGNDKLTLACVMYYFLGTITSQDEDERPLLKMLSQFVRQGDTFFDIGANVGFYSFFLGPLCGTSGSVHAFEANPLLTEHLRRSAELNRTRATVIVNPVAVGKENNRVIQLFDPERIGGSSLYVLDWLDANKSVTVPLTTIDEYRRANKINRLDFIKIDIEGSELDAFHGMSETLEICPPPLIVCELALLIQPHTNGAQSDLAGNSRGRYAMEIVDFLGSKGYEARHIHPDDGRIDGEVDQRSLPRIPQNLINIAFVRPELRSTRPELFRA